MFFIPSRDGIEFGKVGIRDGIEFRSKISGRDAKNPGIFGMGWDRDGRGSITSIQHILLSNTEKLFVENGFQDRDLVE